MKRIRNEKGFTIIELLIVLLVLAALAAIFTPQYYKFAANQRVRGAIRALNEVKKGINDLSTECRGMPLRGDTSDQDNFLQLVDLKECGINPNINTSEMLIWRGGDNTTCEGNSLGKIMAVEGENSNAFCIPVCEYGETGCGRSIGSSMTELFTRVQGDPCTPSYPAYSGGSPGWNYNLLTGAPTQKPVSVICGITTGHKTPVKIVFNTSGVYNGVAVRAGSAVFDINGSTLPNQCPCGPWCENMATGEKGCCDDCWGQTGIGYKF